MSIENRTLALAGVYQAAELVRQIAQNGCVDQAPFEASISSILRIDAASTVDVYGELNGVKMGLQTLASHLNSHSTHRKRDVELMQYVLGIIFLERKLNRHKEMLDKLAKGIEEITLLVENHAISHLQVVARLAYLYTQTLSTFHYRIHVSGEERYLSNPNNAEKIRALLLAGIRSAVLWRQKGGNRWQFFFSRHKLLQVAQHILKRI
jgi:high frequency lysogenization protein